MMNCGLMDVPSSIESLTALHALRLGVSVYIPTWDAHRRAFSNLACLLPTLRLLQHLQLHGLGEDDVAVTGHSLKVWPLPLLIKASK